MYFIQALWVEDREWREIGCIYFDSVQKAIDYIHLSKFRKSTRVVSRFSEVITMIHYVFCPAKYESKIDWRKEGF